MARLTVGGRSLDFAPGPTLLELLRSADVAVESPCGGKGFCGKCRVLLKGESGPATAEERRFLTASELERGVRLACVCRPLGDVTASFEEKNDSGLDILTDGAMPDVELQPQVTLKRLKLPQPRLHDGCSLLDHLRSAANVAAVALPLLRRVPEAFAAENVTAVFYGDELIDLISEETDEIFGLAADIGTTTVVVSLVSLRDGRELGSASAVNPQKDWGLDVISRIDCAATTADGLEGMRRAVTQCLSGLTDQLCRDHGIARQRIYEMVVGANATMVHLLLGVNPRSLGRAPFSPVFRRGVTVSAAEAGIPLGPGARLYVVPGVSAYIGGDIVAGMLATELAADRGVRLFIDIGTNGEIVLSRGGHLSSCSCAAGPALEGMNISCGMRASEGAIEAVTLGETPGLKVIGGGAPRGLCGSAILDVLSEAVRLGMVGRTGRLKPGPLVEDRGGTRMLILRPSDPEITVTQSDLRQVQLARGAILSGFLSLLEVNGLTMRDLDQVIVAGQFGHHLSRESLTGSGLIPAELSDRIVYGGNTSRAGAMMCLLSRSCRREAERIAGLVEYVELSVLEDYDRLFARCLQFDL